MASLSEKWCIPIEDLRNINGSNSAYQALLNATDGFDVPLSVSARRVNVIYCWTRSADEFISFDNIVVGLKIRKEFVGSGFHDGEIVKKLDNNILKVCVVIDSFGVRASSCTCF